MGRPLQQVELNPQERETLQAWSRRGRTNQALAMRARIVLLAAEGVERYGGAAGSDEAAATPVRPAPRTPLASPFCDPAALLTLTRKRRAR